MIARVLEPYRDELVVPKVVDALVTERVLVLERIHGGKVADGARAPRRALLDPELDPVELIRSESWSVMAAEAERRLQPSELLAYTFTQLQPLLRLPRRVAQVVQQVEAGSLKIRIAPTELESFEHLVRSTASRNGAAIIVAALLVASALMARVSHTVSLVGFACAAVLGLYTCSGASRVHRRLVGVSAPAANLLRRNHTFLSPHSAAAFRPPPVFLALYAS